MERTRELVKLALERVLARDSRCDPAAPAPAAAPPPAPEARDLPRGAVALGSDHGGFELKEKLLRRLRETGYSVRDLGTGSTDAVDYPDFALKVAALVAKGEAFRGIVVDGVGVGSAMAANKVPGVRAATCWDAFSTKNSREHNDANVLCIGGRVLDEAKAFEMARIFLDTDFGGDRHARRVEKIMAIERAFLGAARR
jgi:ribose 5-phosphate isomerase B